MDDCGPDPREIDLFFESRLFKVLSEPVRLELLRFLAVRGPCDISTVAKDFPKDRSVISRHLRLMADYGLLFSSKVGRNTFYSLNGFEFLRTFEDTADRIRELLKRICPAEYAEYERTGKRPNA